MYGLSYHVPGIQAHVICWKSFYVYLLTIKLAIFSFYQPCGPCTCQQCILHVPIEDAFRHQTTTVQMEHLQAGTFDCPTISAPSCRSCELQLGPCMKPVHSCTLNIDGSPM